MKPFVVSVAALIAAVSANTALAADPAAGKKVAQGTCAVCHGLDGIAKVPDAPHLAGENVEYLMRQLKAFKSGERKHEQMSIIAQSMKDEDMENVSAWYSQIQIKAEMPK
ncbi:c-type cytochrome [Dongia deserti]|uniref:c-type cytochrome n=1 Tax=Dongia deserti TaxID=2268030 RepID=UPI000E64C6CB|nr:cytochrome c [Dongia deserti]